MSYMDAQLHFARRLRDLRKESGLTIRQFCDRCSISAYSYNYYTRRGGMPNLYTAMMIAAAFGMTLDQLLGIRGRQATRP